VADASSSQSRADVLCLAMAGSLVLTVGDAERSTLHSCEPLTQTLIPEFVCTKPQTPNPQLQTPNPKPVSKTLSKMYTPNP
jgi:hypothetical protein